MPRPTSAASRTVTTGSGRSISTATAPLPMSSPTSSISRTLMAQVAASAVTTYQVSAAAL